jgi:lauroyl/myristoyl acyltransferase
VIRPPLRPGPAGDARADVLALTQRLADEFERLIAAAPDQWHVLSHYWREPDHVRVPA